LLKKKQKNSTLYILPQSQNKNINNMCTVRNPVLMISEQGCVKSQPDPIVCRVDCLFPYHRTGACVRTNPPAPLFYLAGCQFNLSSER
jgi:hypothetical protein